MILHANQETISIEIGKSTRDSDSVYSLIKTSAEKNGAIWKISNEINQVARSSTSAWAVPTFINMPLYAIDELAFDIPNRKQINPRQINIRKKDEKWAFTHPFSADANKEKVLFTLNQLVSQKVSSFDAPIDDLDLNDSWNIKLSIMGMGESKDYYLKSNNDASTIEAQTNIFGTVTPFQIEDTFKESLNQWTTKLRETQIFNLQPNEIQAIKLSSGSQSIELKKNLEDNWLVAESNSTRSSNEFEADYESIAELMRTLNTVEVKSFLSFNPPRRKWKNME